MAFDQLYVLLAGVVALVAAGFVTHSRFNYVSDVPAGLPWVGQHRGFLSDLRTRIASLGSVLETIESGYRKASSRAHVIVRPRLTGGSVFQVGPQFCSSRFRPFDGPSASLASQMDNRSGGACSQCE